MLAAPRGGAAASAPGRPDPRALVKAAIDYWRGTSSDSVVEMTIHRPDWERTLVLRVLTLGSDRTLVRVLAPKKDAGTGTLLVKGTMWSFSPKVNRVIRIPASMMHQSWMGSDFSNNDVARSDEIVDRYRHRLLGVERDGGREVYVVESVPLESAPVVWGREVVRIRDDEVLLGHDFYDQDGRLVKRMRTLEVRVMGGRPTAARQRMEKVEAPGEWTEVRVRRVAYGARIPEAAFTLSALRNPRRF
nr:outer membrane lipoprotein-sorting protein [Dissulfurirhabdus thermomarina]